MDRKSYAKLHISPLLIIFLTYNLRIIASILTIIFGTNNVISSADRNQNQDCRNENTENIVY